MRRLGRAALAGAIELPAAFIDSLATVIEGPQVRLNGGAEQIIPLGARFD